MTAPPQQKCPPAQVQTTVRTRFLGAQPVPTGQWGQILGLAADERYVYATYHRTMTADGHDSPADGELIVLDQLLLADPAADPVVARLPVGRQPRAVAVNPQTGKIYVLNWGQQGDHPYSLTVLRRSGSTFAHVGWIPIGLGLVDVAVNPRTNRIYVSNSLQSTPGGGPQAFGRIHVIDGATDTELKALAVPVQRPAGLAFDESTDTLYAALAHAPVAPDGPLDAVAAISCGRDGSTHTVQKVVPVPTGSRPYTVAAHAGNLYLASMGNTPTGPVPPNVTRFRLDGTWATSTVGTAFGGPVALAVNPGAKQLHVTTNAGFQSYDLAGETITPAVAAGPFPQSVVVDATGAVHLGDGTDGTLRTVLPVVTSSPLGEHWTAQAAQLGAPVSGVLPLPGNDPRAAYQVFEQGAVFASTRFGAVTVSRDLTTAWADQPVAVRAALGPPTEPSTGRLLTLARGSFVLAPTDTGARAAAPTGFPVALDFNPVWLLHRGSLGDPVENESTLPDGGRRQRFQYGEICWRSDLGVQAVWGPIYDEWSQTGATGPYGYPTETVSSKVYGEGEGTASWDRGVFEHIAMFFPSDGGQGWILPIGIQRAWDERGGATGLLGFPVDSARGTPAGGTFMDFQNGVAVWHPEGHPHAGTWSFSSAQMRILSFLITGSDGFPDGERDLFVRAVLERVDPDGTRTNILNKRFPHDGGDFDAADHTFNPPFTMELAQPLRGLTRFETMFASYDAEGIGEDVATGTVNHGLTHGVWNDDPYNWDVQPAYTVDNLWGMTEDTEHHQYQFTATYRIAEFAEEWQEGVPFRKQWWWKVNNFSTPRLNKEQYARTFADVDSSSVWGNINPLSYVDEGFESLYYHLVYKSVCDPGNCFGMSLEAIYSQKGMSLFPQPVYKYGHPQPGTGDHRGEPDPVLDAGLIHEFNIKHGYQVGSSVVGWFLRQFGQGLTHNPKEVFRRSRQAFEDGDLPLLSFTRSFKFKGHAVLPFRWEGGDDDHPLPDGSWGRIYVADPKHEWMRDIGDLDGDPDTDHDSDAAWYVRIDTDNSFSYDGWHGGTLFNNRMFYVPWNRMNAVPTLPSWDVLTELAEGYLALVAGDAVTEQVTDGLGRNLFRVATGQPPESWDDIVPGADERIPDLVPLPVLGAENEPAEPQPLLLYGEGRTGTHTYSVRGGGGTYRWGFRSPAFGAVLTSRAGTVADRISTTRAGEESSVAFTVVPGGSTKEVSFVLDGMPRSPRTRQFLVDRVTVTPKQRIAARLRDGGREVLLENSGAETVARVRVRAEPGAAPTAGRQVPLAAGKVTRIRPADWSPGQVGTAPLRVEVRDTVDGPPVRCFEI